MRVQCRLRELRGNRSLREMSAATREAGVEISAGILSLIERGVMLAPDRHVAALEHAYGQPIESWYEPRLLLALEHDPAEEGHG